jgi:hypothetical protein
VDDVLGPRESRKQVVQWWTRSPFCPFLWDSGLAWMSALFGGTPGVIATRESGHFERYRSGKRYHEHHVTPADKQLDSGIWNGWLKLGAADSFIVTAATSTHC